MNSYTIGLSGSWWFLVLAIILAGLFTVFTYKNTVPPVSIVIKTLLISLRSLALGLIVFAVFEPVITIIKNSLKQPVIAVVLDNSVSVSIDDSKGNRKSLYYEAIEKSDFEKLGNTQIKTYLFDSDVRRIDNFNKDSLNFNGQMTDISKAFRTIAHDANDENIRGVLLISDGSFNTGTNPIYDAEELGMPVFTIGIGDTSLPKDASIQSILTNEICYVDNPVPININVLINGYTSGDAFVSLFDNDNKISEQKINITPGKKEYTAIFQYNPKQAGIRKITVTISNMDGELTDKNNKMSEFIHVLENKRKIVIFAGYPSSDLSFLENALVNEKGIELKKFVQKKEGEFLDKAPTQKDLDDAQLIIFIGFPINSSPQYVLEMVKDELNKEKPFIFLASQFTDYNKLNVIRDYLPFTIVSSKPQEYNTFADVKKEAGGNPLLRINGNENDINLWNQLPPVFRTETFVKAKPESEVLATIKVNNVPLAEPFLITRDFQNKKSIAILGYGLYRWKMLGYATDQAKGRNDTPDIYTIFFQNAYKWLSVGDENKNVRIKTTKKHYTNFEKIEFLGEVYDAAFTQIDNANVLVKVNGAGQSREVILTSAGNGRYTGQLDALPEGDYAYSADAKLDGNSLGSDNGRFSVGEISLEYRDLAMNYPLLNEIAKRSGGKFYFPSQSSTFLDDLKNIKTFLPQSISLRSEYALWNLVWILAISIALFAAEWFIRKRAGMI